MLVQSCGTVYLRMCAILRGTRMNSNKFEILDLFLTKVPDEPKADGLIPGAIDVLNGKQTNTLIHQVTRRTSIWKDDDLEVAASTTRDPMSLL